MRLSLALAISIGALLRTVVLLFQAPDRASSFAIGVLVFSLTPYAVAALLAYFPKTVPAALGYTVGVLVGDLFMMYSLFYGPQGQFTGLWFLIMPVVNLLGLGPVGALVSWVGSKLIHRPKKDNAA